MGADIDGVIETREPGDVWETEVDLLDFGLGRERYTWDCLFGFGSGLCVDRPLFDARGLPDDISEEIASCAGDWQHSHSYATWAEIAAVDWDAPVCDTPAYGYVGEWRPGLDGELALDGVVWASLEILDAAEELFGEDLMPPEWPPGGAVPFDGAVYRPVVITPRMFAPPDGSWGPVWTKMRELAAEYGDDNVRLVVWFG
ncbi:hypothetical protein BN159_5536 [Streptomyces davaonensis JCM 4913]|uniref:Uncharacterized protein n=1 Tax=Streptomyces davaonensis (strain DSM 101723 / JCM 4913 / KCC S-0913 / 768) TaxID=1214101 RepID=K4RA04_STRDJ|nr:hypothetical protein [Streptomyces davaonensis]CCK29915.1 hypothetical protein BN159_5536 [Streptomyces davaonensis JCM 4913]